MKKRPLNLTIEPGVVALMKKVMRFRKHSNQSVFIEELIRDEYEFRFGPMRSSSASLDHEIAQQVKDLVKQSHSLQPIPKEQR